MEVIYVFNLTQRQQWHPKGTKKLAMAQTLLRCKHNHFQTWV